MNIDELQAGRELDALIAEKVFGPEIMRPATAGPESESPINVRKPGETIKWIEGDHLPHYSTNIAAAWLVVERIEHLISTLWQRNIDYNHLTLASTGNDWVATFASGVTNDEEELWCENPENYRFTARGDSPMLAICRAALKAVVEVTT